MSRAVWISLGLLQCLAVVGGSVCDSVHSGGRVLRVRVECGPEDSVGAGWLTLHGAEPVSCNVTTSGGADVLATLPGPEGDAPLTLTLCATGQGCRTVFVNLDVPKHVPKSSELNARLVGSAGGPLEYEARWPCQGHRRRRSTEDKRGWAGDDMQWLKRSADSGDWEDTGEEEDDSVNYMPKRFDPDTMDWLRKRSLPYPWSMQKKPTWNAAGVNWLRKRAWTQANTEWIKRAARALDRDWLKRNWNAGDVQWLKKRSQPFYYSSQPSPKRWNSGEVMNWLRKRSDAEDATPYWLDGGDLDKRAWTSANTEWIKRSDDPEYHHISRRDTGTAAHSIHKRSLDQSEQSKDLALVDKKNWGASGMSWIKRDSDMDKKNWGSSGMSWIKREDGDMDKKNWGASGMSWIKRDPEADKRNWGASGMSWIKRDPEADKRNWGASGMSWIKRDHDADKKNWGGSGMSWIKRNPDKKNWGASGMSWIKRDGDDKRNWGASGMSWIKRDPEEDKRNWGASGMSWIKRDDLEADKKNWGASGMSWIKRDPEEKRNWGASGMSWIKRADMEADKKNWGASGMSWIKRDPEEDKRNWGASGMSWIKRGDHEADKKNWGASGMSWIKRGDLKADKKNWGASGMSWIKRDQDKKRNWGASGMSWIKRSEADEILNSLKSSHNLDDLNVQKRGVDNVEENDLLNKNEKNESSENDKTQGNGSQEGSEGSGSLSKDDESSSH